LGTTGATQDSDDFIVDDDSEESEEEIVIRGWAQGKRRQIEDSEEDDNVDDDDDDAESEQSAFQASFKMGMPEVHFILIERALRKAAEHAATIRCEKMEIEVTENVKSFVSEVKEESGKYVDLQNILLVRHAPRTQWCNLTPCACEQQYVTHGCERLAIWDSFKQKEDYWSAAHLGTMFDSVCELLRGHLELQ